MSYVTQIFINIFSLCFLPKKKVSEACYITILSSELCRPFVLKKGLEPGKQFHETVKELTGILPCTCSMAAGILEQHETTDD